MVSFNNVNLYFETWLCNRSRYPAKMFACNCSGKTGCTTSKWWAHLIQPNAMRHARTISHIKNRERATHCHVRGSCAAAANVNRDEKSETTTMCAYRFAEWNWISPRIWAKACKRMRESWNQNDWIKLCKQLRLIGLLCIYGRVFSSLGINISAWCQSRCGVKCQYQRQ